MDWLNNTYGALSSAPSWLAYPAALLLVLLPFLLKEIVLIHY
jgi:hypothetical protein